MGRPSSRKQPDRATHEVREIPWGKGRAVWERFNQRFELQFAEEGGPFLLEEDNEGGLIGWPCPADRSPKSLSGAQVLKIVRAVGIPLPGWAANLPSDWLEWPRREVSQGQKPPIEVLLAMRSLMKQTHALRGSLMSFADKKRRKHLRATQEQLRRAAAALREDAFRIACSSAPGVHEQFEAVAVEIEKNQKRLKFWADRLDGQVQHKQAVIALAGEIATCFERIFDRGACGGWVQKKPSRDEDVHGPANKANSPFIRFAMAFCAEIGYSPKPLTMQTALYDFRGSQKE